MPAHEPRARHTIAIHENQVLGAGVERSQIARARRSKPLIGVPYMAYRAWKGGQAPVESVHLVGS